jgi:hypothetical protein
VPDDPSGGSRAQPATPEVALTRAITLREA